MGFGRGGGGQKIKIHTRRYLEKLTFFTKWKCVVVIPVLWFSHFTVSSSRERYNSTATYAVNITIRRGVEVPV